MVEVAPYLRGEKRLDDDGLLYYWGDGADPAGIAIVCGRPSGGLVVVDVDPRNGGDCEAARSSCPTGYVVRTGGGGLHLYAHSDADVAKGKTGVPGVDRQGTGGYVVAPPSVHPDTGLPYVLESDGEPGPLPQWCLGLPGSPLRGPGVDGAPWVADTLLAPHATPPGSQDETLTRLAWWAAGRLDEDVAFSILWRWCQALPLGNPADPWTEAHVRQKLLGAYAKRSAEVVVTGAGSDAVGRGDRDAAGHAHLPAEPFVPVSELTFPEQPWIVTDFVAPGAFTEVIGKVKKGKSTLVYQLIRAVVTGESFLDRPTVQTPVVLLTEQQGTSLRMTLERAGLLDKPYPLVVVQKPGLTSLGLWHEAVPRVVEVAAGLGARLIVTDTLSRLARLHGDLENSSGAVACLEPFERAREQGIACVFVRHARKGASGEVDDIADAARGSSAITGDMDVVIRLRPHGTDDIRVLSWESRLTDDPDDLALKYVDGVYQLVEMPEGGKMVERRERAEAMRRALAGSAKTLDQLVAALGWSKSTVLKYKRLVEEGEPLPAPPGAGVKP